jgi:hypothetical protein
MAVVVWLLYAAWIFVHLERKHTVTDFIVIGRNFVTRTYLSPIPPGGESPEIRLDPKLNYSDWGYDGQFYYFIAVDPVHAQHYVDVKVYRYQRIFYPMLARGLALGRPRLIPYTMLGINWFALGLGTVALAGWLKKKGAHPAFSLVFGLYPGLFVGLQRDLTEPLAFALVAVGIHRLASESKTGKVQAVIAFALAALTREATAAFPIAYAIAILFEGDGPKFAKMRRNSRRALGFAGGVLGPIVLFKGLLFLWFGPGESLLVQFRAIPFEGLLANWPWNEDRMMMVRTVIIPAVFCLVASLRAILRGSRGPEVWLLLVHSSVFSIMLQPANYAEFMGAGRYTVGTVLAALLCIPTLAAEAGRRPPWLWISSTLWLAPVPFSLLEPVVSFLVRGR